MGDVLNWMGLHLLAFAVKYRISSIRLYIEASDLKSIYHSIFGSHVLFVCLLVIPAWHISLRCSRGRIAAAVAWRRRSPMSLHDHKNTALHTKTSLT